MARRHWLSANWLRLRLASSIIRQVLKRYNLCMSDRLLPESMWDKCSYCGSIRKESQGTLNYPKCFRQGCPGQHAKKGIPLK
jgi:hypothetical protein